MLSLASFRAKASSSGSCLTERALVLLEGGAEAATDSDRVRLRVEREEEAALEEVDAAGLVVFCFFFGGIVTTQSKKTTRALVVA